MTSIVKGDRIKVAPSVSVYGGKVGEVTQIAPCPFGGGEPLITLRFDDGVQVAYDRKELLLLGEAEEEPKVGGEISFSQIRKGDRIRCVREFDGGFVLTMEGVAERLVPIANSNGGQQWRMGTSHCVASSTSGADIKQHHILVERPEPLDHVVLALRPTGLVDTTHGYDHPVTKSEAENRAKTLNDDYAPKTRYWAVKVPS